MRSALQMSRRRMWMLIVGVAATALLAGTAGIFGPGIYQEHFSPYRNWPATGVKTPADTLRPNLMLVVTCDGDEPEIKQVPLGDDADLWGSNYGPLWMHLKLYAEIEPVGSNDYCYLHWDPMSRYGLPDFPVIVLGEDGLWHNDVPEVSYEASRAVLEQVKIRTDGGIAVLLLTIRDMKPGPEVLNGPNDVPAPSRKLLES